MSISYIAYDFTEGCQNSRLLKWYLSKQNRKYPKFIQEHVNFPSRRFDIM